MIYSISNDDLTNSRVYDKVWREVEIEAAALELRQEVHEIVTILSFSILVFEALRDDANRNVQTLYRSPQPLHF